MEDYQSHAYNVNAAVEMLQNVDGETMELILKEIGMEWQMLSFNFNWLIAFTIL